MKSFHLTLYSLAYRKRKNFKPNISVVIHHDGHTEVERVDLIPTLQQHDNLQNELQTDNEQFIPELDDADTSEEDDIEKNTSLYYQKVEKKAKGLARIKM